MENGLSLFCLPFACVFEYSKGHALTLLAEGNFSEAAISMLS